jgi:hypothetical protein
LLVESFLLRTSQVYVRTYGHKGLLSRTVIFVLWDDAQHPATKLDK